MATKESKTRVRNMREVFTFDDDLKFQIRDTFGNLLAECETLPDAERALDNSPDGAFIAYPRAALEAENERIRANEEHERQERRERKAATQRAEWDALEQLAAAYGLAMLSQVIDPATGPNPRTAELRDNYEEALTAFAQAMRANGRVF